MWCLTQPTIKEEDHYFFSSMACALENINQSLQGVESQLLKSCLKSVNIGKEPNRCSMLASMCRNLSCQKYFIKTPDEVIKHLHFRLSSNDSASAKRPHHLPTSIVIPPTYSKRSV